MTYVVTDACIKCKYMDCVEVCPVDCFYEGEVMLVINPNEWRLGCVADQALVAGISEQAPARIELIRDAARGGDAVDASARTICGQARSEGNRRTDAEISPLIPAIGEQDARSDRENVAV